MKVYSIKQQQVLPITIPEAWEFFSSPHNLSAITPSHLNFQITGISGGDRVYAGQIIQYRIRLFPFVRVRWVTEITHVQEHRYFVDEQRFGPYALWHHQHHFREVPGGIEMTDEVCYAIPLGVLGRLVNQLFVRRELNAIFDYRRKILETIFRDGSRQC